MMSGGIMHLHDVPKMSEVQACVGLNLSYLHGASLEACCVGLTAWEGEGGRDHLKVASPSLAYRIVAMRSKKHLKGGMVSSCLKQSFCAITNGLNGG